MTESNSLFLPYLHCYYTSRRKEPFNGSQRSGICQTINNVTSKQTTCKPHSPEYCNKLLMIDVKTYFNGLGMVAKCVYSHEKWA